MAYAIGFVAWKSRRVRPVAVVAAFAFLLVAPWVLKNWIWMHNPLAPFFNSYFPNPYVTIYFEEDYKSYFRIYDLASRWQIPVAQPCMARWAASWGRCFFWRRWAWRRCESHWGGNCGWRLWYSARTTSATSGPISDPAIAFRGAGDGDGVYNSAGNGVGGVAVACRALLAAGGRKTHADRYWRLALTPWQDAFHLRDPGRYFRNHLALYPATELVERVTLPGSTVFTFKAIPDAYTSRRVLVDYESAANQSPSAYFRARRSEGMSRAGGCASLFRRGGCGRFG